MIENYQFSITKLLPLMLGLNDNSVYKDDQLEVRKLPESLSFFKYCPTFVCAIVLHTGPSILVKFTTNMEYKIHVIGISVSF